MGPSLMEWWDFTVQWSVRQPVPGILNLSDYVDPQSVPQTTGQRSTPSAAAGSAEQLQSAGDEQAPSVRDDVTEHEREESW